MARARRTARHLNLQLPRMAIDILEATPRTGDYLFGPFRSWGAGKDRLDMCIASGVGNFPSWRLHDLRRTMRSGLGRLGVPPHVAELAVNHVRKGVQAVYDRYQYQPEIKSALATWATHIETVLSGATNVTVTALRRA